MPHPLPQTTIPLAERHEGLWLRLEKLHKDISAIAAKKPDALVGDTERSAAEGVIRECRTFLTKPIDPLPVSGLHFAGLAVQLGQFLARMEDFENRHAYWDGKRSVRVWRVAGDPFPVGRLRQEVAPIELTTFKGRDMRAELVKLMEARSARFLKRALPPVARRARGRRRSWGRGGHARKGASTRTYTRTCDPKLSPLMRPGLKWAHHLARADLHANWAGCAGCGPFAWIVGSGIGPSRRAIKRRC